MTRNVVLLSARTFKFTTRPPGCASFVQLILLLHLACLKAGVMHIARSILRAMRPSPPNVSAAPLDPLDAVIAAPNNHKVLFEDDHVRILEVTVQPGETEKMHHHPLRSVFVHDSPMPKFRNNLADDGTVMEFERNIRLVSSDPELPADVSSDLDRLNTQLDDAMNKGLPMVWVAPAQETHSVYNRDSFPMHFYRIEFKRIDGYGIIPR